MNTQTILYVEDEPNLGRIVSETLEQRNFEVMLVKDGNKVMDLLEFKTLVVLWVMLLLAEILDHGLLIMKPIVLHLLEHLFHTQYHGKKMEY